MLSNLVVILHHLSVRCSFDYFYVFITEQLKDHGYSKILRLRNKKDLDELRDKAADRKEWQCLVEKLGETTGDVDDSDESTTEAENHRDNNTLTN